MKARRSPKFWVFLVLFGMGSCFAERDLPKLAGSGGPRSGGTGGIIGGGGEGDTGNTPEGGEGGAPVVGICRGPVDSAEALRARALAMSADVQPTEREVFVQDLYQRFRAQCGGCHVDQDLGGFIVNLRTFPTVVDQEAVDRITSNDPDEFMPPESGGGIRFRERNPGDPVRDLAEELQLWIDKGRPADVYYVPLDVGDQPPYLLTPEVGEGLTNIGSCVPEVTFPFASAVEKMDELDEFFADLEPTPPGEGTLEDRIGLPKTLSETDLFTLDSAVLARHGVVAFAPNYPLWSDGAGKLRHVRVPRGESIRFDKHTQKFEIPENTRFYKTFLKPVIDTNGEERFRKIETRLIVSRPDVVHEDGSREHRALFGSYKWNEEETQAELVTLAHRNGEPFKDYLFSYITNEPKAIEIRATNPPNLTYELTFNKALRHYAIPASERCIQCHMGSSSSSFILGFTPLQLVRRPVGEGGTIEPSGPDELTQVERLIELGVITGIESPSEIALLEDSEGARKPRNDLELKAQAYMVGNCGHCHNPNGYPSTVAPELKPLLDFWPSRDGGIFQFPLERFSPRIRRGPNDAQMPYITPSLRDMIPYGLGGNLGPKSWTAKYRSYEVGDPDNPMAPARKYYEFLSAPWRSLIYRNAHTPFTYADDYAILPHMPLNTPGFDCRAFKIFGEWMVSIPSVRKRADLVEDYVPEDHQAGNPNPLVDMEPQPYVEVLPGDPAYDDAAYEAGRRLGRYQSDQRHYALCPDNSDIVDPDVVSGKNQTPAIDPPGGQERIEDGVPERPHWVETDLSERPGPWEPRRSDWEKIFIDDEFPDIPTGTPNRTGLVEKQNRERKIVETLRTVTLDQALRDFALTPFPLAPFTQKEGCDFSGVRRLDSYSGSERLRWMDIWLGKEAPVPPDPAAPVFAPIPGQAVYDMICINCHGRKADSQGRQAETVQIMTGGQARVANFMIGLFGPEGMPGENRERVFGEFATGGVTPDDWGARYLAWMALGGTRRDIPSAILNVVGRTDVGGAARPQALLAELDANMLAAAQSACKMVLPIDPKGQVRLDSHTAGNILGVEFGATALIQQNGDAELWQRLCSFNNPPLIRGATIANAAAVDIRPNDFFHPTAIQQGELVVDHRGRVVPYGSSANYFPWCLIKPTEAGFLIAAEQFRITFADNGVPIPYCPDSIESSRMTFEEIQAWPTRGAINAGLAVFVFLDQVARGNITPIRYNECERLDEQ